MAGAPNDWPGLLGWAEAELGKTPAPIRIPADPRLSRPNWPVVRLDERMASATVTSPWAAPTSGRRGLASIGPFRLDRPTSNVLLDREQESGSLRMTFSGFSLRREAVSAIAIEMHMPFGRHFDLAWSRGGSVRIPVADHTTVHTILVETDGFADWQGPLEKLALVADGSGPGVIDIRSIRFLAPAESFPLAAGTRRAKIDRRIQNTIYAHCPSEIKFENVAVPAKGRFRAGLARIAPAPSTAASSSGASTNRSPADVALEVIVLADTERATILSARASEAWRDVSAPLDHWAGQSVSIVLKASSADSPAVALWGNPTIYQTVGDAPVVAIYLIGNVSAKHVDLYGYARPTMPHLKALAGEGVWFANMYANAPETLLSIPNLMFSLSNERHGVLRGLAAAPRELVSLAAAMRAAGFATASFVTDVNAGPRRNLEQGFDDFYDRIAFAWTAGADRTAPLAEMKAWLAEHRDRPAFLYVHTAEPDAPYAPPSGFAGKFAVGYKGRLNGSFDRARGIAAARTPEEIGHVAALYDEELLYADSQMQGFLDALEELGMRARTTLFVTSDHGEEFREHGNWLHGKTLYQEVLRIPLVITGRLVTARGGLDAPADLVDVMPTILAIFDLPNPYALSGRSLAPALRGRPLEGKTTFASSDSRRGPAAASVIDDARWKLIYRAEPESPATRGPAMPFALFDLSADRDEKSNVIDAHRNIARRLIGALVEHQREQHPYVADNEAQAR